MKNYEVTVSFGHLPYSENVVRIRGKETFLVNDTLEITQRYAPTKSADIASWKAVQECQEKHPDMNAFSVISTKEIK